MEEMTEELTKFEHGGEGYTIRKFVQPFYLCAKRNGDSWELLKGEAVRCHHQSEVLAISQRPRGWNSLLGGGCRVYTTLKGHSIHFHFPLVDVYLMCWCACLMCRPTRCWTGCCRTSSRTSSCCWRTRTDERGASHENRDVKPVFALLADWSLVFRVQTRQGREARVDGSSDHGDCCGGAQ